MVRDALNGKQNYLTEEHFTFLWEGAELGNNHDLITYNKHDVGMDVVGNDELSLIVINPGK